MNIHIHTPNGVEVEFSLTGALVLAVATALGLL